MRRRFLGDFGYVIMCDEIVKMVHFSYQTRHIALTLQYGYCTKYICTKHLPILEIRLESSFFWSAKSGPHASRGGKNGSGHHDGANRTIF